jgi:hypothetical protein
MNTNRKPRFLNTVICNLVLVFFAAFIVCGCTTKMALDANKGNLAKLSKPVGIFTLRTENAYKPSYQPQVKLITIVSSSPQDKKTFAASKPYKQEKHKYYEYLISVDLAPGDYSVGHVQGKGSGFLISGGFSFPVNAKFNLTSGITYLGHVTMVNRERKEGEERSGGIFPLIDQSVCGFSGGSFDVSVSDRGETDIPDFIQAYPPLKDANITKAVMQK